MVGRYSGDGNATAASLPNYNLYGLVPESFVFHSRLVALDGSYQTRPTDIPLVQQPLPSGEVVFVPGEATVKTCGNINSHK